MSEVQTRGSSARGRGGFRGGRGGYRGSRGAKSHTGAATSRPDELDNTSVEEEGEVGELKAKYADKLPMMREICEGWGDEDLVYALQETNGDEGAAMDRITSGVTSKWGEVKKKQPKHKDSTGAADPNASARGRGRGGSDSRGRGRGAERGARGAQATRGTRQVSQTPQSNGFKHSDKPVADDGSGDASATNGDATAQAVDWANEPGKDSLASLETDKPKPAPAAAPAVAKTGGWASLFAKPVPAPAQPKAPSPPAKSEPVAVPEPTNHNSHVQETTTAPLEAPAPVAATKQSEQLFVPPPIEAIAMDEGPSDLPSAPHSDTGASELTPAVNELTAENVNKLPDTSNPIATATAASTVASTQVQDSINPALPNIQAIRPGMSGHAASALRATSGLGRAASYSRKVMDQQEAVVMPGNHASDRTAVQFGKMGLGSDDVDADADEDREEPETRAQMPDDSPAAPRASMPPAPHVPESHAPSQSIVHEAVTESQAPRHPPGVSQAPQAVAEPSPPQTNAYADQYRYAQGQKPFDPFSQPPHAPQGAAEPFSNQLSAQSQQPPTSQQEAYQQAYQQQPYSRDYASYYGHNQGYDQQRSGSAFGTSAQDTPGQYASAGPRAYGSQDLASGGNTPNPNPSAQQSQSSGHMQAHNSHAGYPYGTYGVAGGNYASQYSQYTGSYASMGHGGQAGQTGHGGHGNTANNQGGRYGASRPAYDDVRRQQDEYYANQYNYAQNSGFSNSYNKSQQQHQQMYGAPQQQYSQEYSSSPGNAAFNGREAYGRAGSTQPTEGQSISSASHAFGGNTQDPFTRAPSGFGHSQHGVHGSEDPAKPTGPSPSLQTNRPGSAAQSMGNQQQPGLSHPQASQQAFGGYPQYGAGFNNQNPQHSSYAGYGGSNNAFAGYNAATYARGGWGNHNQYGGGHS